MVFILVAIADVARFEREVVALRTRRLRAPSKAVEMKVMAFEMFQRGVDRRALIDLSR